MGRLKRLSLLALLAAVSAVGLVSDASAGGIRDYEPCPADSAFNLVCPDGTVGVPYSIKFRAVEEPPCRPGDDFWHIKQDAAPPGLSMASDGTLSGTPTEAGTWAFWIEMKLPNHENCNGDVDTTQERVILAIKPGVPKLTIGPEQSGVPIATVASPFSLQMTATVSDAKTWTISAGALPAGLTINAATGLISGTPTAAGTFTFTVRAEINPQRVDTKTLVITVREPLVVSLRPQPGGTTELPQSEVGVRFTAFLQATGGFGTYTWALASGELPPGLILGSQGAIAGRPSAAGTYEFSISVTDQEGRVSTYDAELEVAERLAIETAALRAGKVGRAYRAKLVSSGGALPAVWKLKRGPLPKGLRFDRAQGVISGTPKRAGRYTLVFELRDELGVVARKTLRLTIAPAPKKTG